MQVLMNTGEDGEEGEGGGGGEEAMGWRGKVRREWEGGRKAEWGRGREGKQEVQWNHSDASGGVPQPVYSLDVPSGEVSVCDSLPGEVVHSSRNLATN